MPQHTVNFKQSKYLGDLHLPVPYDFCDSINFSYDLHHRSSTPRIQHTFNPIQGGQELLFLGNDFPVGYLSAYNESFMVPRARAPPDLCTSGLGLNTL